MAPSSLILVAEAVLLGVHSCVFGGHVWLWCLNRCSTFCALWGRKVHDGTWKLYDAREFRGRRGRPSNSPAGFCTVSVSAESALAGLLRRASTWFGHEGSRRSCTQLPSYVSLSGFLDPQILLNSAGTQWRRTSSWRGDCQTLPSFSMREVWLPFSTSVPRLST